MKQFVLILVLLISVQHLSAQNSGRNRVLVGTLGDNIDYSVYYTSEGDAGYWDIVYRNCNSNYDIVVYFEPVFDNCFKGVIERGGKVSYTLSPGKKVYSASFYKPSGYKVVCFSMGNVEIEKTIINPNKGNITLSYFGTL